MSENIDKKDKFIKLAEARVNDAINKLQSIGKLANKRNYTYEETQAKKIVRALKRSVKDVETAFLSPDEAKNTGFTL